jgi:hypothetical protein
VLLVLAPSASRGGDEHDVTFASFVGVFARGVVHSVLLVLATSASLGGDENDVTFASFVGVRAGGVVHNVLLALATSSCREGGDKNDLTFACFVGVRAGLPLFVLASPGADDNIVTFDSFVRI